MNNVIIKSLDIEDVARRNASVTIVRTKRFQAVSDAIEAKNGPSKTQYRIQHPLSTAIKGEARSDRAAVFAMLKRG